MASPNSEFTELVTSTLRDRDSKVYDNVTKHNALYRRIKNKGNSVTNGGRELVYPLEYAENRTLTRYSGYDRLSIQASDVLTSVKYDLVQYSIAIVASGTELIKNRGAAELINLVRARIKNAEHTAANTLSKDFYSSGSLSNQVAGLAHIIQDDGTGTVGGINASTYTWWKNKFLEATGNAATTTIRGDMHNLWLQLCRGSDKPDLILATHDFYRLYWQALSDFQRYGGAETTAGDTFSSLKFMTADVVFDDNDNFATTGERFYYCNTDYLKLVEHSDRRWGKEAKRVSVDQDAEVVLMLWAGQFICTNRSLQGTLFDAIDS